MDQRVNFVSRWPPIVNAMIWIGWTVAAVALTWTPFLWHIDIFRSPGPIFHTLILATIPLLAALVFGYSIARRGGLWRHEPLVLVVLGLGACLFYQTTATLVMCWLFVACYGLGRFCRRKLRLTRVSLIEDIGISTGIGFAVFICVLFFLGLAGGYHPLVLYLLPACVRCCSPATAENWRRQFAGFTTPGRQRMK